MIKKNHDNMFYTKANCFSYFNFSQFCIDRTPKSLALLLYRVVLVHVGRNHWIFFTNQDEMAKGYFPVCPRR